MYSTHSPENFILPTSYPLEWNPRCQENSVYEYIPLRLSKDISHKKAAMQLAIASEFSGWELTRVRRYTDGSRRVLLRRKKNMQPIHTPEEKA